MLYLDYNATTPLDDKVKEAMKPYIEGRFGNPSSSHWYGVKEKEAVEKAREDVASLIGCSSDELVFTSGGTESINWALKGTAERLRKSRKHIVTSQVEHVAVLECCRYLQEVHDVKITYVGVNEFGQVDPEHVRAAIREDTSLVTIMLANNETGTVNDIRSIAQIARSKGVLVHTDASQAIGKIPVDVNDLAVDFLTIAGHKLYAPAGVGALYIRKGTDLPNFMHGAGHEKGRRAGTENTMHLVALGTACKVCKENLARDSEHLRKMRDLLHELLVKAIPGIELNGHPEHRLPNTLNVSLRSPVLVLMEVLQISFPRSSPTNDQIIARTADKVAFSAGSACHAGQSGHISHVLKAMDISKDRAFRCLLSPGVELSLSLL